jgi:hypothetical protein
MIRTVVSLKERQKKWLDKKAKDAHVTMTEMVRQVIERVMKEELEPKAPSPSFRELLALTKGTWKGEDGLKYQLKMRGEWERR